MSYGTPADKIVAYTYLAETLCPGCTCTAVQANNEVHANTNDTSLTTEAWLDRMAVHLGINRYDEREFDSSDFPKVVFASQTVYEDMDGQMVSESCDHCGEELV